MEIILNMFLRVILLPVFLLWLIIGVLHLLLIVLVSGPFVRPDYSTRFWDGPIMGYLLNLYFGIKV